MPRREAANQRVREAQRARILDGARTAFATRGLAATMADVAAAAGVSQGLAYRYFESKDEIVRALVAEALQAAPASDPRIELTGTPGERLDALVSALVAARQARPELFQLFQHALSDPDTPGDLLVLMRRRGTVFAMTLRQMIVEAQATGDVPPDDPDELVTAVIACLDGLARLPRNHPDGSEARFPGPGIILRLLRPPARRDDA